MGGKSHAEIECVLHSEIFIVLYTEEHFNKSNLSWLAWWVVKKKQNSQTTEKSRKTHKNLTCLLCWRISMQIRTEQNLAFTYFRQQLKLYSVYIYIV